MSSNITLDNVIYLIFNQCKQPNMELVSADKIIEYIVNNFDYSTEEAKKLQFNQLFKSLKTEGKLKNNLLSKDQFEKVFKIWIPFVENSSNQLPKEEKSANDAIFSCTQHRLSRSLTNLKAPVDFDRDTDFCGNWRHWGSDISSNDENTYGKGVRLRNNNHNRAESISPHEDPFRVPLNVIKCSSPRKKQVGSFTNIGFLEQPNLRYIKQYKDIHYGSFSDSEMMSKYGGSINGMESLENIDIDKVRYQRKRHRSSMVGEGYGDMDLRDLIAQIRQIKFKNSQLVEINDRLQLQLELAEENIRGLNSKYVDLEKKSKRFSEINEENNQLILEMDDIKKCMEAEVAMKKRMQSEKTILEGELTAAKEYIHLLTDKLSSIDEEIEKKDSIITNLRTMISQQEEFCVKLQKLNAEKDDELANNQKGIRDLTDAICDYEEKINIISKQKEDLEKQLALDGNRFEYLLSNVESTNDTDFSDRGCGGHPNHKQRFTTQSEYQPTLLNTSSRSIKLELASELLDSPGDSPLCEKLYFEDGILTECSDESSYQMLNDLLSMITSLRLTLGQYREQLENASLTMKANDHFTDEISLSYLSYLNDSINLISLSTEKAANCQRQFNDTFNLLMKRISTLKSDKKNLILRNEKLLLQLNETSNNVSEDMVGKLCFLEEQLRKERLLNLKQEKEIETLKDLNKNLQAHPTCFHCGQECLELDSIDEISRRDFEAMNLEEGSSSTQKYAFGKRRFTVGEVYRDTKPETFIKIGEQCQQISSASLGNLSKIASKENYLEDEDQPISPDRNFDEELAICRNYNMSTDDLVNIPRYKISRSNTYDVDIEGLIENSWLAPHSKLEERRASVFVQLDYEEIKRRESDAKNLSDFLMSDESHKSSANKSQRRKSSSCSSSNDTSDANSVDLLEERKKLAQQLEIKTLRMQSRSPAGSLLNSSLVTDDLKSLTPTVSEVEMAHVVDDNNSSAEPVILIENFDPGNGLPFDINDQIIIGQDNLIVDFMNKKSEAIQFVSQNDAELPTINIMEPSAMQVEIERQISDLSTNGHPFKISQTSDSIETDSLLLQASFNKSTCSSGANSVVGDVRRSTRASNAKLRSKRMSRPHTIAITNINTISDTLSNYDDPSVNGDFTELQEAIDMLNNTSRSLLLINPEELENKYSETILMYRTDRPTIFDRALDANSKCNRALTNVEQEFNILRHIVKNISAATELPVELLARLKTSINVLEKCVEYLSAKSETLGSVQQEIKLSCLADVMLEYSNSLQKQKENHLRELEELRTSMVMFNDMGLTNASDQSRTKRSILAGKNAKTRFQIVAQNTVRKTSILRQLSNSLRKSSNISSPLTATVPSSSSLDSAACVSSLITKSDPSQKISDRSDLKYHKIAAGKFFPATPSVDDNGENLFPQRAQQNQLSSTMDIMNVMIEESENIDADVFAAIHNTSLSLLRTKLVIFFGHVKTVFGKITYLTIGLVLMIGLLLPWIFIPADNDSSPLSQSGESRLHSISYPDGSDGGEMKDSSPPSPSSLFLSNINVVRHNPAAV